MKAGTLKGEEVIDIQLVDKILVKVKGTHNNAQMLSSLMSLLDRYPRAAAAIKRMEEELDEFGAFQFSR
jgi:hypothetical protein